jgi:hypothetical protein
VNIFENNDLLKQITLNSLEEFDVIWLTLHWSIAKTLYFW